MSVAVVISLFVKYRNYIVIVEKHRADTSVVGHRIKQAKQEENSLVTVTIVREQQTMVLLAKFGLLNDAHRMRTNTRVLVLSLSTSDKF